MQIYLPDLPTATTSDKVVLHVPEPLELELSDPSLSKPHRKLKQILAMSLLVVGPAQGSARGGDTDGGPAQVNCEDAGAATAGDGGGEGGGDGGGG